MRIVGLDGDEADLYTGAGRKRTWLIDLEAMLVDLARVVMRYQIKKK